MARIGALLLTISFVSCLGFGQATNIRTTTTLPVHCNHGQNNTAVQIVAVYDSISDTSKLYFCRATDTWDQLISMVVALSWDAEVGVDTYNIYRAQVSGGPYTKIKSGLVGVNYVDPTVNYNVTYYYVITSVTGGLESAYSNQVKAVIPN